MKNQKKNQQKRRREAARRASEGDTPSSGVISDFKSTDNEETQISPMNSLTDSETIDSGVASSMDEGPAPNSKLIEEKQKSNVNKSKQKSKKSKQKFQEIHNNSDLIFNLDF